MSGTRSSTLFTSLAEAVGATNGGVKVEEEAGKIVNSSPKGGKKPQEYIECD